MDVSLASKFTPMDPLEAILGLPHKKTFSQRGFKSHVSLAPRAAPINPLEAIGMGPLSRKTGIEVTRKYDNIWNTGRYIQI